MIKTNNETKKYKEITRTSITAWSRGVVALLVMKFYAFLGNRWIIAAFTRVRC
jgi:hypothetical protein